MFDPGEGDPGKAISDLTEGLRAEVAFDCVGNQPAFDTAIKVTGRRGIVCVAGLSLKPIQVPFMRLWGHEKEITFSSGYENEFPAAIGLLADGRIDVESLISARIQLADLVEMLQPAYQGSRPICQNPGLSLTERIRFMNLPLDLLRWNEGIVRINARLEKLPQPVIAAVTGCHGRRAGAGPLMHLSGRCQLAKLGLPEVKLGIIPGTGGTQAAAPVNR